MEAERVRAASEIQDQINKIENESFGSDEDMDKTIVENELEESVVLQDKALMMDELEVCMTPRDPVAMFQDAEILNMSRASLVSRGSLTSRDFNQRSFIVEDGGEEGPAAFNFDALMRDKAIREGLNQSSFYRQSDVSMTRESDAG